MLARSVFFVLLSLSVALLSCSKDRPAPVAPAGKSLASLAAPAAPTNLRFDAPTDSSCTVRWDASDGATDYDINYKPAEGGRWTNEPHRGIGLYNTIDDLQPNTEYRWAVRAENSDGASEWIHGPNFTTRSSEDDSLNNAPPAPTNLRFDALTDSSCTVRWDASDGATDYDVNYKPAEGGRWTNEPHRGIELYNTIHDLEPDTEYRWAVRAENSDGTSEWIHGPNFTTLPEEQDGQDGGEITTVSTGSPESDRAALEEFYQYLLEDSGPNKLTHWLSRSTLAKWRGVKVNEEGRVVELVFDNHNSAIWDTQNIPEEGISERALRALTRLTELRRLELYHAYLDASPLPETIGNLQKLEYLDLRGNRLIGAALPEAICELRNLKYLNLYRTNVSGPLPDCFGNLTQLEFLDISRQNSATKELEPLPSSIGNLRNLKYLSLYNTGIKTIPPEMGQLTQLEELHLTDNPLTGRLPSELGSLRNLKRLGIWGSGPLPPEWGQMESLERLIVVGSYTVATRPNHGFSFSEATPPALEGTLPPEWGQMRNLQVLSIKGFLSGPLPPEWGQLHKLEKLYLDDLELTGPIPAEWGQMTALRILQISDNLLAGPLPAEIGDMTSLVELRLNNNLITGPIPPEINKLTSLESLYLGGNQLTGPIPDLSEMRSLVYLILGDNRLSGEIPSPFPGLLNLQYLSLSDNQFTGPFPDISDLRKLRSFGFEGNDSLEVYGNDLEWKGCIPKRLLPPKLNPYHRDYEGNFHFAVCQNE